MEKWKWLVSVIFGAVSAFSHQYGMIIAFVGIAVVFDWITGVVASVAQGEKLSSKKGAIGFWKKIGLFLGLFFGFFLDYFITYAITAIGIEVSANIAVFGMIIGCYIVINESISVCENIYRTNQSILPPWVVKLLVNAKDQIDEMGEDSKKDTK